MKFQTAQMKFLGLDFEKLPAVTVNDISAPELALRASQWERPMRNTEVACLYSHRLAWQKVAQGNEPVLILEDDALLSSKTPEILTGLERQNIANHVTLEIRGRKKLLGQKAVKLINGTVLSRLFQDRTGAGAYVIWPDAASILLKTSDKAAGLADAIIAGAYEMSSWQVEPAAALQLDQCDHYGIKSPLVTRSTIGINSNDKPAAPNLFLLLNFKRRRLVSQLRMGLRQLFNITRARRRFATIEIQHYQHHISADN
ncbi:MAG: glycosyltransferase family 25 protein [Hyphomicrobiales bacterium]|nr:glycosyltransferase family 25 protein [Hyphomicrobiales bacterium]